MSPAMIKARMNERCQNHFGKLPPIPTVHILRSMIPQQIRQGVTQIKSVCVQYALRRPYFVHRSLRCDWAFISTRCTAVQQQYRVCMARYLYSGTISVTYLVLSFFFRVFLGSSEGSRHVAIRAVKRHLYCYRTLTIGISSMT